MLPSPSALHDKVRLGCNLHAHLWVHGVVYAGGADAPQVSAQAGHLLLVARDQGALVLHLVALRAHGHLSTHAQQYMR